MVGILKNPLTEEEQHNKTQEEGETLSDFRKRVYANTQLNAKLTSKNTKNSNGGMKFVPRDVLSLKHERDARKNSDTKEGQTEEEKLQWNQKNLEENEIKKLQYQDIHVDEPKTPYQGAVDPQGEYYKVDEEDVVAITDEGLNDFSLGEPEVAMKAPEYSEEDENEDEEQEEESDEARHKRFEEMRKKHYNVREIFQNKHKYENEEEEEEEEEKQLI